MARKPKRKKTTAYEKRIKSVEARLDGTVERLDAAVAEARRLGKALDELQRRDHMEVLRKKKNSRGRPSDMETDDPDETVS